MNGSVYESKIADDFWNLLISVKDSPASQYDQLITAAKDNIFLPDRSLLIADSGKKFHGLRNREWSAESGNIHLSMFLAPDRKIDNFGSAVMALPAVSIIQALQKIGCFKEEPKIKWVNDIFVGNKKLAGIIAHTQQQGAKLSSIIIGIGLNVKKTPIIEPIPSVPGTTSLWELAKDKEECTMSIVFQNLLNALQKNVELLYDNTAKPIIDEYKKQSMIINRKVKIYDHTKPDEPEICSGIVERIGDFLELYIKGIEKPVIKGRLILL
jgi:biotin-[acetyl-CoA-carboxylase] ligase BirA-like protein